MDATFLLRYTVTSDDMFATSCLFREAPFGPLHASLDLYRGNVETNMSLLVTGSQKERTLPKSIK